VVISAAVFAALAYVSFALFEIALIPTGSMESTVLVGDHLLVSKVFDAARLPFTPWRLPRLNSPRRGEIISFHPPTTSESVYLKRVVAVAGDLVEIRAGVLFVNRVAVAESYAAAHGARGMNPLVVPEHHVFVLGDNRDNSEDSRAWGAVSVDSIVGRPEMVVWSVRGKPSDWLTDSGSLRRQFYWSTAQHLLASTRWSRIGLLLQ
jgi:signal peptidase I